ncbi:MAG: DedA family protein [Luteibacter sp.]|uniref:YqaA family protein n=1 Tax=Rhodanobacteraceae TaxID=1775411 RepID=UPI000566C5E2|nr:MULTISPECIES: DedA family protein [Rhodanobacteraceae]MDQ7996752.1 DedA family protein [Luteibacter sp.]MDQ8050807.1 DedA family protein [Luteibacter sp.]MDR6643354.1 membrane protein YqaA with SNARE-associated domain [Luteibacter sp. 1214]SDF25532.1 membrane protein YqaA, SNARE-associated domain [Dyella sp. 333MFSha]SKB51349.1 membrane protein YqaA, SNARE-associated domain [Luteibacter sp. 22Crub2.1]
MRMFSSLYERAIVWARHRHAVRYLAGLSFVEAFIFPVMPEVMLAPMMLAEPRKAFRLANWSLLFSLLGSLVGYMLGHYAFEALKPLLESMHLLAPIMTGVGNLQKDMEAHSFGLYIVLAMAALQPVVPMKFVTWASGIVGVPLLPFLLCMLIGRGKRVWLLALLIRIFGERAEKMLRKHIEWIGWAVIVAVVLLAVWWFLLR